MNDELFNIKEMWDKNFASFLMEHEDIEYVLNPNFIHTDDMNCKSLLISVSNPQLFFKFTDEEYNNGYTSVVIRSLNLIEFFGKQYFFTVYFLKD